jgi:oligoendopeptidase F
MTIKERCQISKGFQWDLSSLFESDQSWEQVFESVKADIEGIKVWQGRILESGQTFLTVIESSLALNRKLGRLYTYAKMKLDENTKDSVYQTLSSRAETLGVAASEATSYIVPELLSGDPSLIQQYVEGNDVLKGYSHYIDEIMRYKPHTLSAAEEKILAQAGEIMSTPHNVFNMLSNADLKFPNVKNEKGEEVPLTHGSFIPLMKSNERQVRREAFETFYSVYEGHKNTFATLIDAEVKKNVFGSRVKKYASARDAALFGNNIPTSVYDHLIEAVHDALPDFYKYMKLRKHLLGVDALHMYDVYPSIIKDVKMEIPYESAKEMVLNSLEPLGSDYVETVKRAYEDRWIDVYENQGKRSGAYSFGAYDSKPYILLNYQETLDDVFTLTHEMGHSMHSYYTRANQPYVYGNYSIFVAEVASTTNEALLNDYLLKTIEDKQEKLFILNHYLEQFRGTIFRQTMFAEFEREIHKHVESGGALTADRLSEIYGGLNQTYYGDGVVQDEQIRLEWARIPHFYYDFYVFQYATGFSAAIALSNKILEEGDQAVTAYKTFLKSGSSNYPLEVLKLAGVDMTTSQPVKDALKVFGKLVDEMAETLGVTL